MRAIHNLAYVDPENWGRKWTIALLCTARPDGEIATFRRGYIEARVKFPTGRGRWPSLWSTDLANDENGAKRWGAVEIDYEWYNQDPEGVHGSYYVNCGCINHLPNGGGFGPDTTPEGILFENGRWKLHDMSSDFHVIGIKVGDTTVTWFHDGKQIAERPLPRAATVGKFYWMLNLGLTSDWPVSVPP